ncbi:MAG TPA: ATP-binding cassette domain-containing protein, partial [Syntrophales bacterium]|nr:ATP-binding cassette domain-containing protein [Syntrophales bacterium]
LASLRRKIAMVPQEPYFFDGTIRSNITFGLDPVPHETELEYLLDQTGCTSFLKSFDHGIETVVGQRGNRLSQGQRQRLAIVHALAKKPDILVLDEPTSALDSESEQAIRQTLQQWRGTLTILVIAHRLSTIAHANRILVMDNGRLVAVGTHESLIEMSSLYRGLFENQMVQ